MTTLALFDLDNTLIDGDSDFLWGVFLTENNYVDPVFKQKHLNYLNDYNNGILNINEFLQFTLTPLTQFSKQQLNLMHKQFMDEKIKPIIRKKAKNWINEHQKKQHITAIITATNEFITQPIARHLKIPHLIATQIQQTENHFTNRIKNTPCFQSGKIWHLNTWKKQQPQTFETIFFYSDSFNDIPLLEQVDHPIAVTPDAKLQAYAKQKKWKIIQ